MPETHQPVLRPDLRADCAQCAGLCCVALTITASDDFAIDKPAGEPCPNLKQDFSCGIHARLRDGGFPGCTVYDCFGAGQKVTQVTFGGRDWRQAAVSGRRGADLIGADLRGADLRGTDLRSSYLTGADLRQADLTAADLIGADLRDTDLRGANLAQSIFLTQMQLNAARGDAGTRLPPRLVHPSQWS